MNNEYIWSKGPFTNDYSQQSQLIPSKQDQILSQIKNANITGVLWIKNGDTVKVSDLIKLSQNIKYLQRPVILITTDGVRPVPSSYPKKIVTALLAYPNILIWRTQNYDGTLVHPKLKRMPIGFDLHNPRTFLNGKGQINKFNEMLKIRKNYLSQEKHFKIFCDAHVPSEYKALRYTHPERGFLHQLLLKYNSPWIVLQNGRTDFKTVTNNYNKYKFALSPRGKGLDCHRTWELLLAGAIVITRSSSLDQMYIDNQLPVVILDSWDELFQPNLKNKMQEWMEQYSEWTKLEHILPRLRFDWWIKS